MVTEESHSTAHDGGSQGDVQNNGEPRSLQVELHKKTPFESLEQEAFLSLMRTESQLGADFERLFREHGLSTATYNTLRVLRGAGAAGRKCQDIGEHLVAATPDVTRLIDRLQQGGLCARVRSKSDRRVVMVRITQGGLDLLSKLDEPVQRMHKEQLGHLTRDQLRSLIDLLAVCRARPKK